MKLKITAALLLCLSLSACDRVGSDAWCEKQGQLPKGEWTLDDTKSYTKYCVLGMDSEKMCEKLEDKDKGDWTANEAAEYAKNCIAGRGE